MRVTCSVAGLLVAALPWLLLNLVTPKAGYMYSGGHVLYQDGRYTPWGWFSAAQSVGTLAFTCAVAGLIFWFVAAWRMKVPVTAPSPEV